MPAQFTLPPDTRSVGSGDPPADMNGVVDTLTAMGAVFNVLNTAYAGGADPTGAADSAAAIQAAVTAAITAGGGIVRIPKGAYKVASTVTASLNDTVVHIVGDGKYITTINNYGAGPAFTMYDSTAYDSRTVWGGGLTGMTIDGTNASAGAAGAQVGDILQFNADVAVQNFTGAGSIGFHFLNQYFWTEEIQALILSVNCAAHVVFDVSASGASTRTGSYDHSDIRLYILQTLGSQDGVVFQNAAYIDDGRLLIQGDFQTITGTPSSAVLRFTGTAGAGRGDTGATSHLSGCDITVGVECGTGTGTVGPYTIYMAAGGNYIYQCSGLMDFSAYLPAFQGSNAVVGTNFIFAGPVYGDSNLAGTYTGNISTNLVTLFNAGKQSTLSADANGLLLAGNPSGLFSAVQQSQAAATAPITVASTVTITSLGYFTDPIGEPAAGARYRVTAHGRMGTTTGANVGTVDIRWGSGTSGTLLTSLVTGTTAPALTASLTAVPVEFEGEVSFITATTAVAWLKMTWQNSATATTAAVTALSSITAAVTVTVTGVNYPSLDWTWGTSNAANTITVATSSWERVS